jgi:hypothetical protein
MDDTTEMLSQDIEIENHKTDVKADSASMILKRYGLEFQLHYKQNHDFKRGLNV